jgi:cysteinyl-tRNA synthetase
MSKSLGGNIRLQDLIDEGYDPLAYRYFCLNAHYRSHLKFATEGLDGAATALDRLRTISHELGEPGRPEAGYLKRFAEQVNQDLNTARALAVTWELARSDLDAPAKKATLLEFDRVLGLRLGEWRPCAEEVPAEILDLVEQRQQARAEKLWAQADALRDQIQAAGYKVRDTASGPEVRRS